MTARSQGLHEQIAANIKTYRAERGITLTGLSELTGIGKSTLSNLERGQGNPTIETLWQLAQVLNVSYGDLVGIGPAQASTSVGISVALINHEESERKIETFMMTFESDSLREAAPHANGVTEHVVVLRGALTVGAIDDRRTLYTGQSRTFKADQEHLYQAGDSGAQAIVSVIYPDIRLVSKNTYVARVDWPVTREAWSGVQDMVRRLCVDSKHGMPFGRLRFTGCPLDLRAAYDALVENIGSESNTGPGISLAYAGSDSPEVIVLANAGTHECLPCREYPAPLSKAVCLANKAARRVQLTDTEYAALRETAASADICLSTLAAEVLTRAGHATAPSHVGVKTTTTRSDDRDRPTVLFEDRIDVDSYAAFELVHPAYARQCVAVAMHLHAVDARQHGRVLDVGTGPGLPLSMIDELVPNIEFVAIDPSPTAYRYLEKRFAKNDHISPMQAGVADLPIEPKYNHVISIGASHHLDTSVFLCSIRDRMNTGGTLCVSDEMIMPFKNKQQRSDHLLAHHLRYIHNTLVPGDLERVTPDEAELVRLCRRYVPNMLYNALAGEGEVAAGQARRLLSDIRGLDLPAQAAIPELAFYRFHVLELEALVAGLDYEVEQKTSAACFVDLANEIGFQLISHRRIYATHGRDPWHAGTHVVVLEAV